MFFELSCLCCNCNLFCFRFQLCRNHVLAPFHWVILNMFQCSLELLYFLVHLIIYWTLVNWKCCCLQVEQWCSTQIYSVSPSLTARIAVALYFVFADAEEIPSPSLAPLAEAYHAYSGRENPSNLLMQLDMPCSNEKEVEEFGILSLCSWCKRE